MFISSSLPIRFSSGQQVLEDISRQQEDRIHQWYLDTYGENGEALFQTHIQNPPLRRAWRKVRRYKCLPPGWIGKNSHNQSLKLSPVICKSKKQLYFGKNRLFRTDSGREEVRVVYEPVTQEELVNQPFIKQARKRMKQKDGDLFLAGHGLDMAVPMPVCRQSTDTSSLQMNHHQEITQAEENGKQVKSETIAREFQPATTIQGKPISRKRISFLMLIRKIIHIIIQLFLKIKNWLTDKPKMISEASQSTPTMPILNKEKLEKELPEQRQVILSDSEDDDSSGDDLFEMF